MHTRCAYNLKLHFPEYTGVGQKQASEATFKLAKHAACHHFRKHRAAYMQKFCQYACAHYRAKKNQVVFSSLNDSLARIRKAKLLDCGEGTLGFTNGYDISISSTEYFSFEELVGVLLHEELHCFCRVKGRWLSARSEHYCMEKLGETF